MSKWNFFWPRWISLGFTCTPVASMNLLSMMYNWTKGNRRGSHLHNQHLPTWQGTTEHKRLTSFWSVPLWKAGCKTVKPCEADKWNHLEWAGWCPCTTVSNPQPTDDRFYRSTYKYSIHTTGRVFWPLHSRLIGCQLSVNVKLVFTPFGKCFANPPEQYIKEPPGGEQKQQYGYRELYLVLLIIFNRLPFIFLWQLHVCKVQYKYRWYNWWCQISSPERAWHGGGSV